MGLNVHHCFIFLAFILLIQVFRNHVKFWETPLMNYGDESFSHPRLASENHIKIPPENASAALPRLNIEPSESIKKEVGMKRETLDSSLPLQNAHPHRSKEMLKNLASQEIEGEEKERELPSDVESLGVKNQPDDVQQNPVGDIIKGVDLSLTRLNSSSPSHSRSDVSNGNDRKVNPEKIEGDKELAKAETLLSEKSENAQIADEEGEDLPFIDPPTTPVPKTTARLSVMLCKPCRKSQISEKLTCEARIKKLLNDGANLTVSLKSVGVKYPSCRGCHPSNCKAKLDRDVGFDEAAPKQLWGTTPTLKSLPKQYRIPQHVIESNQTKAYFRDWPDGNYILHTYNPSLIPAPEDLKTALPGATYVAVFRLSPLQTCTPTWYPFFKFGGLYGVNLYGFAILGERLEVLRDAIVDVNAYLRPSPMAKNNFEDVRLQYIRDTIYLSNGRRLMAIEVKTMRDSKTMPNMFGAKGLYVKNITSVQFIGNIPTSFKNSHIFEDTSKSLHMDYWPEDPHEVRPIHFRPLANKWISSDPIISDAVPDPSFQSHNGLLGVNPFIMSRARGSACCLQVKREEYQDLIPADHPAQQSEYLLMGISHSKSVQFEKDSRPGLYMYLSKLYAFIPAHPFPTVARSGFFCLPDVEEASQDPHVLFQQEPVNRLRIKGRNYNCPRVHFVSGMTQSATNASEVIVAYGINDCVPRFTVLEKRSMVQRLFLTMYESENMTVAGGDVKSTKHFESSETEKESERGSIRVTLNSSSPHENANTSLSNSEMQKNVDENDNEVMAAPVNMETLVSKNPDIIEASAEREVLPYTDPPSTAVPKTAWDNAELSALLCKACRNSRINEVLSCEAWIMKLLNSGTNLTSSLMSVAVMYPSCQDCHPSICHAKLDRDVGFDVAAPTQVWGTTPTLKSLPKKYRIPQHVIENNQTEEYFRDWPEGNYILHTYNPSLIPAPAALKATLPHATYVAVFRLSPLETCTATMELYPFYNYGGVNLYGFAILDEGLQILRDTIIDINSYIHSDEISGNVFEDVRLQYIRGDIHLINARKMLPIEVTTQPDSQAMPNLFGDNGLYVKNLTSIQIIRRIIKPDEGLKNGHIFEDTSNNLYMEFWPDAPHDVRPLTLLTGINKWAGSDSIVSDDIPDASFRSHGGLFGQNRQYPLSMSESRGSACCLQVNREEYQDLIPADHPAQQSEYLLVGISHSKSTKFEMAGRTDWHIYLSRLYAFIPVKPFPTVARSGFFCLSDVEEASQDPHVLFQQEPVNRLIVKGRRYNCPRVHFVSGMTQSTTNSSEVIVAYGINDCFPRFTVLEKRSMVQRLFLTMYESENMTRVGSARGGSGVRRETVKQEQAKSGTHYPAGSNTSTMTLNSYLPDGNTSIKVFHATGRHTKKKDHDADEESAKIEMLASRNPQNFEAPVGDKVEDTPFVIPGNGTAPNTRLLIGGLSIVVCKPCKNSQINAMLSCEARIKKLLYSGTNLTNSLMSVAVNYPSCRDCHPSICQAKLDREVGFDEAAPKQLWGATPTLKSLPKEYRIPQHVIENNQTEEYFRDWPEGNYILHTYNPSLIPASEGLRATLPLATYVAVFRLSPLQTCTATWYPFYKYSGVNLYGFAVLDERLQVLRDTIIDINYYMHPEDLSLNVFEDVRLQYIRGLTYLINGRRTLPIEVTTQPDSQAMPNLFGDNGLYVKNLTSIQFIRKVSKTDEGLKNGHLFEDASKNVYMEYWPDAPHDVRPLTFLPDISKWLATSDSIVSDNVPDPSFRSHSGLLGRNPLAMSRGRGSACCLQVKREEYQDLIPADHPAQQSEYLLVGISHSKSDRFERDGRPDLYLYLSRLYAFIPAHPFPTVARSGFFCLSDGKEASQDPHVLFQQEPVNRLRVKGRKYDCPRVHFVSGMTQSATNASEVIVAYGINDCVPRFTVLEKHSMVQRLFLTMYESENNMTAASPIEH